MLIMASLNLYDIPLGRAIFGPAKLSTHNIIKLAATVIANMKAYSRTSRNHNMVNLFSVKNQKNYTVANYYKLFSLTSLNKYSDHFDQFLYYLSKPFRLN